MVKSKLSMIGALVLMRNNNGLSELSRSFLSNGSIISMAGSPLMENNGIEWTKDVQRRIKRNISGRGGAEFILCGVFDRAKTKFDCYP